MKDEKNSEKIAEFKKLIERLDNDNEENSDN